MNADRKTGKSILWILIIISLAASAFAQDNLVEVYIFYGQGCQHCQRALNFFEELGRENDKFTLHAREVYFNQSNIELFARFAGAFNSGIDGVPTIFVNDKAFVGFSDSIGEQIKEEIEKCSESGCAKLSEIEYGSPKTNESAEAKAARTSGDMAQYTYTGYGFLIIIGILLLIMILSGISKRRKRE